VIYITDRQGHPALAAHGVDVPKLMHHRSEPWAFVEFYGDGVCVGFCDSVWQAAALLREAQQADPAMPMVAPEVVYMTLAALNGPQH